MIIVIFIISAFLLILNIYGVFNTPYKKIPKGNVNQPVFGRSLNLKSYTELSLAIGENEQDYCHRIFNAISKHIIHYQPEQSDSVPYSVNWILAILAWSNLAYFKFYEFYNGIRAMKKGYGLCSQFSYYPLVLFKKSKNCL